MRAKKILFLTFILLFFTFSLIFSQRQKKASETEIDFKNEFENCTSVLVSKSASVDGSVMTTHSCDGGYEFRLRVIPGKDHKPGEKRPVYRGGGRGAEKKQPFKTGEIPEVNQTYSRFDIAYPFMNEKQLAIGETTFGGRDELRNSEETLDIMTLERIALERASTAREAIKIMGELVEKYGYSDGGECLTLADKKEAWVFEIMGAGPLKIGAVWAAKRVPEGEVFVSANRSRIGEINLEDKENFMASKNVLSLAEKKGWHDPKSDQPFRFNEAYAPSLSMGCRRREWRVLNTLAPQLKLDPWAKEYPFSVKPEKKVSPQDLIAFHRDYYQGTEFDMTKGPAAGPFDNPNRFSTPARPPEGFMGWERSISIFRCSYCIVTQSRDWLPDWIGCLAWFAEDDPKTSCFVPFYCGITTVPESYQIGRRDEFNRTSAWWAFDFVSNWSNLKFSYMLEDIKKAYTGFEKTFFENQAAIETEAKTLHEANPEACREFLTKYSNETAQHVVDEWWALADKLIVKYNDGYINAGSQTTSPGYPQEWLDAVGYGKKKIKNN
ncbi:dipeptidase [Acidobacteriota bacterium]